MGLRLIDLRWITVYFLVGFLAFPALGSSGRDGASFLDIPVGAGPAALGSAYTALAADAYAPTYNPAGLGFVEGPEISGQHLSYIESVHYEYLSAVHPLGPGRGLGGSIQYLGTGDIAGTDDFGNPTGDFSGHYAAYTLAYGQALRSNLSLGAAAKLIHARISDANAQAYAFDIGALARPTDRLSLGVVVANAGTQLTFLNEGDSLPLSVRFGGAYLLHPSWTLAAEGAYRPAGPTSGHAGLEWRPIPMVSLRTGYRTHTVKELSALAGLTVGAGLQLFGQELAYAWLPLGDLGDTHYFSAVLRFGDRARDRKNLVQVPRIQSAAHRGADIFKTSEGEAILDLLNESETHALAPWTPSDAEGGRR